MRIERYRSRVGADGDGALLHVFDLDRNSPALTTSLDRNENVIRFLTEVRQHKDEEVRQ